MNGHAVPRFVVIGNPENRRVHMFRSALASLFTAVPECPVSQGPVPEYPVPECHVVAYEDLLCGRQSLEPFLSSGTILRIESPGENFAVERLLIARGAEDARADGCHWISPEAALQLPADVGRIHYPRQWYHGFRAVMQEIAASVSSSEHVRCMSQPADIVTMFDKALCRQHLSASGVPIAEGLPVPTCFDQLRESMRQAGMPRVFVKLANGSSASGVVALQIGRNRMSATTSVELTSQAGEAQLYNSLRVRTYHRESEIAAMLDWLCREKVVVERWMPKATTGGKPFDLRLLVFPSGLRHVVVRQSRSPITNLHLGNARGDWDALKAEMSEALPQLALTCGKISRAFARTKCVAVDALIRPHFREHVVLELNAFGDLLPSVLHAGQDAYQAAIAAMLASISGDCS